MDAAPSPRSRSAPLEVASAPIPTPVRRVPRTRVREPLRARAPRAGVRRDRRRRVAADPGALGVPDRGRPRLAPLRLRGPAAVGAADRRRRGTRHRALRQRPRGPRDRAGQQAAGLRRAGRGGRHRRRQPAARPACRPPGLRRRGRDPAVPRGPLGAAAVEQSRQGGRPPAARGRGRVAAAAGHRPDTGTTARYLETKQARFGHLRPVGAGLDELPAAPVDVGSLLGSLRPRADRPARRPEVRPDARRADRHPDRRREVDQRGDRTAGGARDAGRLRRRPRRGAHPAAGRPAAHRADGPGCVAAARGPGLDAAHPADREGALRRRRHRDPVPARTPIPARRRALAATGAMVRDVAAGPDGLAIDEVLRLLRSLGVASLLVEGGGRVITSMLRAGGGRPGGRVAVADHHRFGRRGGRSRSASTASPTASGSSTGRSSSPATTSCSASTWRTRPRSRARDRRAEDVRRHRRDARARVGGADRPALPTRSGTRSSPGPRGRSSRGSGCRSACRR